MSKCHIVGNLMHWLICQKVIYHDPITIVIFAAMDHLGRGVGLVTLDYVPDNSLLYPQTPTCIWGILGECLLISSLPGKALRTLVDIARLAERFNMRSQRRAW